MRSKAHWEVLKKYARTEAELERIDALIRHNGGLRPAAKELGIHHSTLQGVINRLERRARGAEVSLAEEHHLKAKVSWLEKENADLADRLAKAEQLLGLMQMSDQKPAKPLRLPKAGKNRRYQVAGAAFLSDTHFDEVVDRSEMDGLNAYDRQIAERRLERFVEKVIVIMRDLMNGFDIVHLDLPIGGDIVSGNIHEELARTNAAEIMDTCSHWADKLAAAVTTLADHFPSVFVPCVVGNHGRNSAKPRHKGRARDNFDWLIYQWVRDKVRKDNVRFLISDSPDVMWQTFNWRYLMTHGDQARGGNGWAGILMPVMRLATRKADAYSKVRKPFDYLIMGHWHQFTDLGDVVVNGSLKGYDEFARDHSFKPEPPQQAFWLTDPERGKIMSGPIFVEDAACANAS